MLLWFFSMFLSLILKHLSVLSLEFGHCLRHLRFSASTLTVFHLRPTLIVLDLLLFTYHLTTTITLKRLRIEVKSYEKFLQIMSAHVLNGWFGFGADLELVS